MSERLRTLAGLLAWLVCFYTPLKRISWNAWLWVLQYAGWWAYRAERREHRRRSPIAMPDAPDTAKLVEETVNIFDPAEAKRALDELRDALARALESETRAKELLSEAVRELRQTEKVAEARQAALAAAEALNERLVEFATWAIREGAFEARTLYGDEIQEKAAELGLLVRESYDPERHGPNDVDAEPGDSWYVFSPDLATIEKGDDRDG